MRILTVTHFFESHGGGIERVAGHLCRHLAALGHDCEWAASAADPAPIDPSVRVLPLKCINPTERITGLPMPIPGPAGLRMLSSAIARADAVIIHDALYCTSIAAMTIARAKGTPVILFQHIAAIAFASATMRRVMAGANILVSRPMLGTADQVVFISQTVLEAFARGGMKRPPRLLFNGVDGEIFHDGPSSRNQFGLPEQGKIVTFVGRFVEKKGLAVIKALATSRPDIIFAMAGSGAIDPTRWDLPNIHMLGALAPESVGDLFRTADILLLPSVGEGYPLVIQEAMACGLPVICGAESARADPAAAHWLQGLEVDLANPGKTAAYAASLLDRPPADVEYRREMAAYAASAYSWPKMAAALANIVGERVSEH